MRYGNVLSQSATSSQTPFLRSTKVSVMLQTADKEATVMLQTADKEAKQSNFFMKVYLVYGITLHGHLFIYYWYAV